MPRKKKTPAMAGFKQYEHKGVKQFGDCRHWNDKNVHAFYKLSEVPAREVGPGDIVDDINPDKRYTFWLYVASVSNPDDSARELDRLRRAGYIKCDEPRFISPTEKFETRDGVLVLGQGIWYACPKAKADAHRAAARKDLGPLTVAEAHSSLAASEREPGFETNAQTRADSRGQRNVEQ